MLAAAAEERLDGKKNSSDFPEGASSYCLAEAGIAPEDVDEVVHSFDYQPYLGVYSLDPITTALYREVFSREAVVAPVSRHLDGDPAAPLRPLNHHFSHAPLSYFYPVFS